MLQFQLFCPLISSSFPILHPKSHIVHSIAANIILAKRSFFPTPVMLVPSAQTLLSYPPDPPLITASPHVTHETPVKCLLFLSSECQSQETHVIPIVISGGKSEGSRNKRTRN